MAPCRPDLDFPFPVTISYFVNLNNNKKVIDMTHKDSPHITEYKTLGIVLLVLLLLTFTTIEVTSFHLMAATVLVALLIAGVKGYIVLTYFMHLKYEGLLLRVLVSAVFLLYAVIIIITFFDYMYR